MWSIENRTPYKTGKTWGRDKDGVHEWIVAVKGTFDIGADGNLSLAEEQLAPLIAPQYSGEPGVSSLLYDADLTTPKPTTDIVLNGTAYAPNGEPSTDFMIGMKVGPISKTLRVRGYRQWTEGHFGPTPTGAVPITQVGLSYERAYGGYDHSDPDPRRHRLDARNPVGCGVTIGDPIGQPLPNFEYPGGDLEKDGPAGLGAIDSYWSPRREYAGTYDEAWSKDRRPLLPADWDPRTLLCSPPDQCPPKTLTGGEPVELLNLTPGGRLRFSLPRVHLGFRTRLDGRIEDHRGRLSMVIIEPDFPRVIMVWLTSLPVATNADYLEQTVVQEKSLIHA